MKTIVQTTLETPRGVRLFIPQAPATYLQTKVVELHWQGFSPSDISFLTNSDVDFVDQTIQEYAI